MTMQRLYLLVAKGWKDSRQTGARGRRDDPALHFPAAGGWLPPTRLLWCRLLRGRRGLGQAFGVSCLLPAPACLAGDLGCQRPFCLYKQSGPGARSGLTQRSVVSAPGWQGGPGSPEFANPLTPLLPGGTFPSLSGPAPVPRASPKTPDPQLPGSATAESSPGRVINVSVGRFAKGL